MARSNQTVKKNRDKVQPLPFVGGLDPQKTLDESAISLLIPHESRTVSNAKEVSALL
jgi:hypothetical protein